MNRHIYFILCGFLIFGCFQARASTPPVFVGGHNQSLTICENSGTYSLSTLLTVIDTNVGHTETWSVVYGAMHGTLYASAATGTGGGGTGVATGMSYTPATGYSGTDSFSVRVTDGTYSDTTTIRVLINPLPGAITGVGNICLGTTTILADGGGGTWSATSSIATVSPASGIVTGVATGNAVITYTLPTGCKTTSLVTVNGIPGSISGTFSLCSGADAGLYAGGGGTWSSANTAVATINAGSGYYTGVSGGSVVMTYTLPDGCSATTIVTVNQTPPSIGGATNVCQGTITTVSDGLSGGAWASSNTALATIDGGGNVTGVSAGIVYITYTLGACNTMRTMTIDPVAPVTGAGSLCVGGTLTVSNAVSGGLWSSAITGVATVSSTGFVTAIAPGSAVITYETPAGCFSSATVSVNAVPLPIYGGTHICRGATTALSDGDGGGTWSSTNTALATVDVLTGVVTGAAAGSPGIVYTVIGGCSTMVIVTVSPLPSAIGGIMSVCTGQTTSLNDVGGGTWASTNPTVATINTSTGYYSGLTADTVTMVYTLAGGCTTTAVVTINPTPSPITGVSSVCQSAEVLLSESMPGGVWAISNPAIATISSGLVTTVSSGSVTITYSLGSCSVTKGLLVNPEAPVTGITTMCNGGSTNLYNVVGGGMWSSATPGVATVSSSGFVTSVSPGSTVITYALPSGCFTAATITVNLVPLPITGVMSICTGATTILSDPDGGGSWSSSNTAIATIDESAGIVTGLASGGPEITYTLSTGCKVTTAIVINPLPSPISGTRSVCQGYSIGLVDGGGGTWTSSNMMIATINPSSGYVSGLIPGSSTMTYTLPSGCFVSAVFTVNPSPSAISGPSTVCQGDSIVLTDAVGLGTWSAGSTVVAVTSSTGTVTGEVPGLATVTYNISGCTTSKVIDVNPVTPVAGTLSLCNGASTVLIDLTPGGTWATSSTSINTITPITGVWTGLAPGTALITYTTAAGCTATATVTVNPLPPAIIAPTGFCMDSSIILSDAIPGGLWTESTPPLASINAVTGELTAFATGSPVITYTLSTGCTVTTRIAINPHPDPITAPAALCVGLNTGLVDGGPGLWSISNDTVATVNSSTGYLHAVSAGVVTITYNLNGCAALKDMTINPLPPPITGDTSICLDLSTTLVDSGGGVWTTNDETVGYIYPSGVLGGSVVGTATITYTLPVTGCYVTQEITVKDCHLAVEPVTSAGSNINVLPNPNNGSFIINGTLGSAGDEGVSIAITNMLGQIVYSNKVIAQKGALDQPVRLNNNLPPGMYLLNLLWGNENKVFHIVIQQ